MQFWAEEWLIAIIKSYIKGVSYKQVLEIHTKNRGRVTYAIGVISVDVNALGQWKERES